MKNKALGTNCTSSSLYCRLSSLLAVPVSFVCHNRIHSDSLLSLPRLLSPPVHLSGLPQYFPTHMRSSLMCTVDVRSLRSFSPCTSILYTKTRWILCLSRSLVPNVSLYHLSLFLSLARVSSFYIFCYVHVTTSAHIRTLFPRSFRNRSSLLPIPHGSIAHRFDYFVSYDTHTLLLM